MTLEERMINGIINGELLIEVNSHDDAFSAINYFKKIGIIDLTDLVYFKFIAKDMSYPAHLKLLNDSWKFETCDSKSKQIIVKYEQIEEIINLNVR